MEDILRKHRCHRGLEVIERLGLSVQNEDTGV